MKPFEYVKAESAEQAVRLLGEKPGTRLKAGGIDLLDEMKGYTATPNRVVNLKSIRGLDQVSANAEGTHVGALVTLAQLGARFDSGARQVLGRAALDAATPQIRNVATVGGNLLQRPRCWYYRSAETSCLKKGGEGCPALAGDNRYHAIFANGSCPIVHPSNLAAPLVALGGKILLTGKTGTRSVEAEKFFSMADPARENVLALDEVLTAVVIPDAWADASGAYLEAREKESFDWALASCTAILVLRDAAVQKASLVLGGVAPVPWRAVDAEKFLVGKAMPADPAARDRVSKIAEEAATLALAGAKPLSGNGYKVALTRALVKRAILKIVGHWHEE